VIIPVGYSHVVLGFTGAYVPRGAAVTFGVENVGAQAASDVALDVLASVTTSTIMGNIADGVILSQVTVKNGPNDTGGFGEQSANIVGSASGAGYSPNTAYLLRKTTDLGGREGRGRLFWPGVNETDIDGTGTVAPARISALQTDCNAFLTALAANAVPMVLLHNSATVPTDVIGLICEPKVATQRRRLRA
jgi:hypothetical protein